MHRAIATADRTTVTMTAIGMIAAAALTASAAMMITAAGMVAIAAVEATDMTATMTMIAIGRAGGEAHSETILAPLPWTLDSTIARWSERCRASAQAMISGSESAISCEPLVMRSRPCKIAFRVLGEP